MYSNLHIWQIFVAAMVSGFKHNAPVENQGAQGLSVHILRHNNQRFAVLVGDLQSWHDALDTGDLLLTQQQVGILELTLLTWEDKKIYTFYNIL